MTTERRSGILMHPTSLPGDQPAGSLGREAYDFVDRLVAAGQSVWQILPLGPAGYGDCPYSSYSAFAGNPLLINLASLTESTEPESSEHPSSAADADRCDFPSAAAQIRPALERAYEKFSTTGTDERREQFDRFCREQAFWLDDYALFQTIRERHDCVAWNRWPEAVRHRDPATLAAISSAQEKSVSFRKYIQFLFFEQWFALKRYANERGVLIFGDLPIFVAEDSADVWAHQDQFHLDDAGRPTLVAGVPPDYFSATGQRWGNPLYNWSVMADDDFSWWKSRFNWNFSLFDLVRVDHFRGFCGCWSIPADHPTAEHGYWSEVPGLHLFEQLSADRGELPLVAEDLGIITPDVIALRDRFEFPGMKILQFAFDSGADNPYLPHNLPPNSVIYSGTHDNDTTLGWWRATDAGTKRRIIDYLRNPCRDMPWPFLETAMASVAKLAVAPMQDLLSLPSSERMNTPGTSNGNWQWRMRKGAFSPEISQRLKTLSHLYGRDLCIPTEM